MGRKNISKGMTSCSVTQKWAKYVNKLSSVKQNVAVVKIIKIF